MQILHTSAPQAGRGEGVATPRNFADFAQPAFTSQPNWLYCLRSQISALNNSISSPSIPQANRDLLLLHDSGCAHHPWHIPAPPSLLPRKKVEECSPAAAIGLRHPLCLELQSSPDPSSCQRTLRQVLPLRHLNALTPATEWWHHDGAIPLAQLPIAATLGSPFLLECDDHPLHRLVLVHDGQVTVKQHNLCHAMATGDAVILPGHAWTLEGDQSSVTTIGFDPLALLGAARSIATAHWAPPSPVDSPLRAPLLLPTRSDGHCATLVGTISLLLPAIHHLARLNDDHLDGFLLMEQLHRLIARLVFTELRHGQANGDKKTEWGDKRLDRLLDYITLHLAEPLPLRVLEVESHYSRRSLHYAFKERFGCSPMQWIRQQRMELALQSLRNARPGETVGSVALRCGYRSPSRFRIDFERTYGWKPSAVLRGATLPNGSWGSNGSSCSSSTSSLAP